MTFLIGIEGLPGSGKTTAIEKLIPRFQSLGISVEMIDIETTLHAPTLRAIARTYPLGHTIRTLLFWILRLHQYETGQEKIDSMDIIIMDRYWGSTIAFDFYGNQVPMKVLDWAGREIKKYPDVTLFFNAPLEVVRSRKKAKTINDEAFAQRLAAGYLQLAKKHNWAEIDATKDVEEVAEDCFKIILERYKQKK